MRGLRLAVLAVVGLGLGGAGRVAAGGPTTGTTALPGPPLDEVVVVPGTPQDLGDVPWDQTAQRTIMVTNQGQVPAPITAATLSNNAGGNFAVVGFAPRTLASGESMTFRVDATPNDTMLGVFATTLTVSVNLPGQAPLMNDFQYRSVGPGIEIMPGAAVVFGGVDVEAPGGRDIAVTIRNPGLAPLVITGVGGMTGPPSFTKTALAPGPIAPGATATIVVNYHPNVERSATNQDNASFVISTGGYFVDGVQQPAQQMITLRGWGIDRHVTVPATVPFGDVYRNPKPDDPRATRVGRVCNTGEAALVVSMVTGPEAPFVATSQPSFTVPGRPAVGESCVPLPVTFRPTAYGDYAATVRLLTSDNSSVVTIMAEIALTGRAVPRPVVVTPGDPMPPAQVVVDVPVRLSELVAGGIQAMNPDADETFAIALRVTAGAETAHVIGTPAATIAPGATAMYDLELVAQQEGASQVVVEVFLDGDDQPHQTVTIDLIAVRAADAGGCSCTAGGGGAAAPIGLALLALALWRRRRATAGRGGRAPV